MIQPIKYKERVALNSLTGIKSSLAHIRSVVSLTYMLYLANERKPSVSYSVSNSSQGISLRPEFVTFIKKYLDDNSLESNISSNPLLVSQIESLYVGITLMFGLGRISFENQALGMTKERTGGTRYPKKIEFASNILLLDSIIQGVEDNEKRKFLKSWLKDEKTDTGLELRLATFLNVCIENNLFKLRDGEKDVFFQTEGMYLALQKDEEVSLESDEKVGPARILNSMLREGLIPWLTLKNSTIKLNTECDFDIDSYSKILSTSLDIRDIKVDAVEDIEIDEEENSIKNLSLQQIFYGAPGTGKSNTIKRSVDDQYKKSFRTTFHPDSDYSTFVGAYKPSMDKDKNRRKVAILDYEGMVDKFKEYIEATNNNITQASVLFGHDYHDSIVNMLESTNHKIPDLVTEAYKSGTTYDTNVRAGMRVYEDHPQTNTNQIVYKFTPQAFTKAYVEAWNTSEDVYLIIEEINRGNCAQIFGDLFQLLDRKGGFSEYPIDADADLADYIEGALKDSNRTDIPEDVKNGKKLMLPSNLYIWATMNTSDQSLFPIDSAFKRRWDWVYIPIKPHDEENYRIEIGMSTYNWWGFLEKINQVIDDTTSSEDKKLGYFFVKAEDKVVKADKFVSKVLFYLWNDVFKNYGFDNPIFSKGENKKFTFSDFFKKDGSPNTEMVNMFLRKLDETIDKEHSFEGVQDITDMPSSLMVKYNGEVVEGTSARNKYVEIVKRAIVEKGGDQVAICLGAELTRTPAEGSTRMFKPIGDSGWFLATNNGIDAIKKNINKIKDALGINLEME